MPGFDLSGAVLSVTWRTIGTHQVLAIFPDRTAWYWMLASLGARADVVGSFRTEVGAEQWAVIERVAGQSGQSEAKRTNLELGLVLTAGNMDTWVRAGTDQAGIVASAVTPIVERARSGPVAATKFETRVATAPTGQRLAAFAFSSIGEQPVTLRIDADTFALLSAGGDWRGLPAPRMGLVDTAGGLLDGLYHPAELAPGERGACVIVLTETAGDPPARGALRGFVTLAGPWPPPASPLEAFEVSSPAVVQDSS